MERNNSVSAPSLSRFEKQPVVHGYSNNNKFAEPVTEQIVYSTSSYSDPMMTSLRLGRRKEYGADHPGISTFKHPSVPAGPTKRSRASYQNMLNPCCQVEGCNLDLKSAKDYHRRHRICESHSKSPRVIVAGMERRFCQQCSRFHDLSEFDDKKRSCRRRLLDHNARRRRVQTESVHLLSPGVSSALYNQRQHNLLLNGLPVQLSNSTWEDANSCILRQGLIRPSPTRVPEGVQCYCSDEIRKSIFELHMDQCSQIQTASSPTAPYLPNAHSLLSSNSWSLNEGHYSMTSLDGGLVHVNYNNHHHYPQGISHQQEHQNHL